MHEACLQVIGHALMHGSSPLGTLLVMKMATAPDRKAVAKWLEAYGPFVLDGDDVIFSKKKRASEKSLFADVRTPDEVEGFLDNLNEDGVPQWWEAKLTTARPKLDKDACEELAKLIKSLKKRDADEDTPVANIDVLAYVEGAIARYHSAVALANAQAEARAKEAAAKEAEAANEPVQEAA